MRDYYLYQYITKGAGKQLKIKKIPEKYERGVLQKDGKYAIILKINFLRGKNENYTLCGYSFGRAH